MYVYIFTYLFICLNVYREKDGDVPDVRRSSKGSIQDVLSVPVRSPRQIKEAVGGLKM
jgi:hypothetical protein